MYMIFDKFLSDESWQWWLSEIVTLFYFLEIKTIVLVPNSSCTIYYHWSRHNQWAVRIQNLRKVLSNNISNHLLLYTDLITMHNEYQRFTNWTSTNCRRSLIMMKHVFTYNYSTNGIAFENEQVEPLFLKSTMSVRCRRERNQRQTKT